MKIVQIAVGACLIVGAMATITVPAFAEGGYSRHGGGHGAGHSARHRDGQGDRDGDRASRHGRDRDGRHDRGSHGRSGRDGRHYSDGSAFIAGLLGLNRYGYRYGRHGYSGRHHYSPRRHYDRHERRHHRRHERRHHRRHHGHR